MKPIIFVMLLLIIPIVSADREGHAVLLAVTETDGGYSGSIADLYLTIKPGSGRVFIDSYPLTKIDTQVSTRFAKEIACKAYGRSCDTFDFFYTIRAGSAIIGGPSAGAATAVLTTALLEGSKINQSVAMTGTINSGGLIGPVGGIAEKLEGAASSGVRLILIPKGERFANLGNKSVDLIQYGKELGLDVIEVGRLSEAMHYFTGKTYPKLPEGLSVDKDYITVMRELADGLCSKSENLSRFAEGNETFISVAQNLTNQSKADYAKGNYYSAASYCFGASINYRYLILSSRNYSESEISSLFIDTRNSTDLFENNLAPYKTFTDLQSYSIIIERLEEARKYITAGLEFLANGSREDALYDLAYANERLYSAELWAHFVGRGNGDFDLSPAAMQNSCIGKIAEAEERYEYALMFFPQRLLDRDSLDAAYAEMNLGRHEVCLFQASKAIADTNVILGLIGVQEEMVPSILQEKLDSAKESIIRQTEKGLFPIAGYSYYEYASSLRSTDMYSALLYSEYSLELSNLDMYFVKKPGFFEILLVRIEDKILYAVLLVLAVLLGISLGYFFARKRKKKRCIIVRRR
jgi:uncharacterized protein